jgi:predicted RNase H-like nuclease
MMKHVGVDGCKAGWFAVTRNGESLAWQLFSTINELVTVFSNAKRILIDIPIGLPWADAPIRPCDRLSRQVLGRPRRSSVFPVPTREALTADGIETARKINRMMIGRSIGAQTWGISPKINEVDRLLLNFREKAHRIREVHPEVCFWALADRKPMKYRKTSVEGRNERLHILQQYEPGVTALLGDVLSRTLRKQVQADDILDASVAFVTAEAKRGDLASISVEPLHDPLGLPMEMLYLKVWNDIA